MLIAADDDDKQQQLSRRGALSIKPANMLYEIASLSVEEMKLVLEHKGVDTSKLRDAPSELAGEVASAIKQDIAYTSNSSITGIAVAYILAWAADNKAVSRGEPFSSNGGAGWGDGAYRAPMVGGLERPALPWWRTKQRADESPSRHVLL